MAALPSVAHVSRLAAVLQGPLDWFRLRSKPAWLLLITLQTLRPEEWLGGAASPESLCVDLRAGSAVGPLAEHERRMPSGSGATLKTQRPLHKLHMWTHSLSIWPEGEETVTVMPALLPTSHNSHMWVLSSPSHSGACLGWCDFWGPGAAGLFRRHHAHSHLLSSFLLPPRSISGGFTWGLVPFSTLLWDGGGGLLDPSLFARFPSAHTHPCPCTRPNHRGTVVMPVCQSTG